MRALTTPKPAWRMSAGADSIQRDHAVFLLVALAAAALNLIYPQAAWAQNPFAEATSAAGIISEGLRTFALAIGGVGMTACLLLGFFNKLNWQWAATGIAVSFTLAIVPSALDWLTSLGGGGGSTAFFSPVAGGGGDDPFAAATSAATTLTAQLAAFGSVLGGIGVTACLMLGYFGKLNWRWLPTGVCVSFAMTMVSGAIKWLSALA